MNLHFYSGVSPDFYESPLWDPAAIYTLYVRAAGRDSRAEVYLSEGSVTRLPQLPSDSRIHPVGVGMSSVTLSWRTCSFTGGAQHYEYCVTVNTRQNVESLCAARAELESREGSNNNVCVCSGEESVCTVSDLLPNTRYFFDVFVVDWVRRKSVAYQGTMVHTHAESHTPVGVALLRDDRPLRVTLTSGDQQGRSFSFRPRGEQTNALFTLQSCNHTHTLTHTLYVSVSAQGSEITSQEVKDQLIQVWLQGARWYRISLQLRPKHSSLHHQSETVCVRLQASSAYHRQGAPLLPHTLQIQSFNTLRSCRSLTLAWMGTEERALYCLYKRSVRESETVAGRVRESETGLDRVLESQHTSETEENRNTLSQHSMKKSWLKSDWMSETGLGRVRYSQVKSKLRSETGGVISDRHSSDRHRVRQRKWRNETNRNIWSEHESETGEVIDSDQNRRLMMWRSDTGQYHVKRNKLKGAQWSETSRVRQYRSNRGRSQGERRYTDRCLAPESRPPDQRVLCKYFQALDARRTVTTATVGRLEPGLAYTFDVYLIRRWALPVQYESITIHTQREC